MPEVEVDCMLNCKYGGGPHVKAAPREGLQMKPGVGKGMLIIAKCWKCVKVL